MEATALKALIREIPDHPEPGVSFKDITTLLADAAAFAAVVDGLAAPFQDAAIDVVVGIEARGFVFSAPVAHSLGAGLVPIRKPGKLPSVVDSVSYDLEYGSDALEIHADALVAGCRALIVDDVLATGGTAAAAGELVGRQGADLVGYAFMAELGFLGGRAKLGGQRVHSLIDFEA